MGEPRAGRARPWWVGAVGYQLYPRSFADSDGDGVGDLPGAVERLDHLAWLGADVVWVNPFYPSPMRDAGYDVSDHCDVDPRFGRLADVDALLARAHALGLRVVVDVVPNHTSSEHPWFRAARSSRESPYRDYYVWRDPAPDGGPPNNWRSVFGGPAWTYDDASGQYWLHLFLPEMPDLNWANPAVAAEFDRILEFWLDRGVDGFRVDVAHALLKHPDLPDLPPAEPGDAAGPATAHDALDHVYDVDQPGTPDLYRRWRDIVDPRGGVLLGEVYLLEAARVGRYVAGQQGLHLAFWLGLLHCPFEPDALRRTLRDAEAEIAPCVAWPVGTHDRPRGATRFGGGPAGRERALALATLVLGLPGLPFVYQGEELGLADVDVPPEAMRDPVAWREDPDRSRDPARTPMPWEPGDGLGFTGPGVTPWLPFGPRGEADTVAGQRDDAASPLRRFRALIAARRSLDGLSGEAATEWLDHPGQAVLAYRRADALVLANAGDAPAAWPLPPGRWEVAFDSLAGAGAGAGGPERADPGGAASARAAREGAVLEGAVRLAPRQALIASG